MTRRPIEELDHLKDELEKVHRFWNEWENELNNRLRKSEAEVNRLRKRLDMLIAHHRTVHHGGELPVDDASREKE